MSAAHRVLVVEDDREIRETLVEILEEQGYVAVAAHHGQAALEYLEEASAVPCMIVLDLMMPVMDGLTFREIQRTRPKYAGVPVIVVSAFRDVAEHAKDLDAVAILKKPLKVDDLLATVDRCCAGC